MSLAAIPTLPGSTLRYVAGLSLGAPDDQTGAAPVLAYRVYALAERPDGTREATYPVLDDLTRAQAEHLWRQLGRALGYFNLTLETPDGTADPAPALSPASAAE